MSGHVLFLIFTVANLLLFAFGSLITGLSFLAYRSSGGTRSFRHSTIGFGLITLGGVIEPVYQLGVQRDPEISAQELLQLQALEGILIAGGLAFLFFSIYRYARGTTRLDTKVELAPEWDDVDR